MRGGLFTLSVPFLDFEGNRITVVVENGFAVVIHLYGYGIAMVIENLFAVIVHKVSEIVAVPWSMSVIHIRDCDE